MVSRSTSSEDKAIRADNEEARKALVDVIQQQTKVSLSFKKESELKKESEQLNQLISVEHSKMIQFLTGDS